MEHLKRKLHEVQLQHSLKKNKTTVEVSQILHGSLSNDATLKQQPSESSHRNSQYIDNTVDNNIGANDVGGIFSGMQITDLLFIKIFAGSGKLTKAAKVWQFETMAIDKTVQRSAGTRISLLDISDPDQTTALLDLIRQKSHRIVAIHLAPACGTASKAREKKLSSFSKMGVAAPQPLRSQAQPLGKDGLSELDKLRTELANQVYNFTAEVMELCISLNILCSVENPENALFWEYPDIKRIIGKGFFTEFHNCMHGGKRRKSTSWWATKRVFNELQAICDNSHQHSLWAPTMTAKGLVFPTAEEATYPELLCKRVAAIIHQYALQEGAIEPQNLSQQLAVRHHTSHRRILDMLPRAIGERISHYLNFVVAASLEPEHSWFFKQQPKGTRVTARHLQRGCMRVDDNGGVEWTEDKTSK